MSSQTLAGETHILESSQEGASDSSWRQDVCLVTFLHCLIF